MGTLDELIADVIRLRRIQLAINKDISEKKFDIPVHLALGHEALAISIVESMGSHDQILLNHRNIHYQIALGATYEQLFAEYSLFPEGLALGNFGSMNLVSPKNQNIYTSNILGNNLSVALGVAQSQKIQGESSATWVVTGDGAIEEGAFYESLLCASSWKLPIIYVIENNQWSLGTDINSRRTEIDLASFSASLGAEFLQLRGNLLKDYLELLEGARLIALTGRPIVIEAHLETLGGYHVEESNGSRYINYHAGGAKLDHPNDVIVEDDSDPVYVNSRNASGQNVNI